MLLQPIECAINGAEFGFRGNVSSTRRSGRLSDFTNDSMLLAHLEEELLPICNACRSYKFEIHFLSDYSSATNVIAKILQFGPIDGCSKILFDLYSTQCFQIEMIEMPVISIAHWLYRGPNSDTINTNGRVKKERILIIDSRAYIPNLLVLVNVLKKVNLI